MSHLLAIRVFVCNTVAARWSEGSLWVDLGCSNADYGSPAPVEGQFTLALSEVKPKASQPLASVDHLNITTKSQIKYLYKRPKL